MNPHSQSEPYPSTAGRIPPRKTPTESAAAPRGLDADVELIRRMQARDDTALTTFYDRWFPIVNALMTKMLKSPDDVEDVVEEVFWQVWRQADRFTSDRGSVQTWLLTIARSRALDRMRATRRLREESIEDASGGLADGGKRFGDAAFVKGDGDPLLDAEHAERKTIVAAALSELPVEQREALELAYFGGLSQSEIADRTSQPLGTIKTRMRLAMQKLRDRLSLLRDEAR
ncbi:MAG: sigma-70 family RNA polymerase sigma factor [Gemmatimonadaceae bacterium]